MHQNFLFAEYRIEINGIYWTKVQLTQALFDYRITLRLDTMSDRKNIYIVDDDQPVRKALQRLLTSVGYDVETYASSQEFLDSVPEESDGCLILDVRMPGLNGLGLQSKLAGMNYKLPIIFITAYDNPRDRKQAMDAGAIAFLRKPFSDQELLDAIQLALN